MAIHGPATIYVMLVVQDQVWGRVTANREEGKPTCYYMDEMHLLLKEEQTAATPWRSGRDYVRAASAA